MLLTSIKLPFVIQTYALPFSDWPFKTGFTVLLKASEYIQESSQSLPNPRLYGIETAQNIYQSDKTVKLKQTTISSSARWHKISK